MSQTCRRLYRCAVLLTPNPRKPPHTGGCRTRAMLEAILADERDVEALAD